MFSSEGFQQTVYNNQIKRITSKYNKQKLLETASKILASYNKEELAEILWDKLGKCTAADKRTWDDIHNDIEQLINEV